MLTISIRRGTRSLQHRHPSLEYPPSGTIARVLACQDGALQDNVEITSICFLVSLSANIRTHQRANCRMCDMPLSMQIVECSRACESDTQPLSGSMHIVDEDSHETLFRTCALTGCRTQRTCWQATVGCKSSRSSELHLQDGVPDSKLGRRELLKVS